MRRLWTISVLSVGVFTLASAPASAQTAAPAATEAPAGAPATTGEPAATETAGAPAATETAGAPAATETAGAPATETAGAPATETAGAPATETAGAPATETAGAPATETAGAPAVTETAGTTSAPPVTPTSTAPVSEAPSPAPRRVKLSGWGGPFGHLTGANKQFATFVGLAGGLRISELGRPLGRGPDARPGSMLIGGGFNYLVLPLKVEPEVVTEGERLNLNYAGLVLGGVFAHVGARVDLGTWALIGGGGGCLQNQMTGECRERAAFFVGEPQLFMHVIVHRNIALSLAAGFRFVAGADWSGPGSWQLAGPVGSLGIVISQFG